MVERQENTIRVTNLSKVFKNIKAVDHVSFTVHAGEFFGIIGPDGAGKTTLFRLLTSLLLPDEGQILIGENDTIRQYKELRKHVGYMPGKFSLYQDLTVEENLKLFATVFNTTIEENYHFIEDIYEQLRPFRKRKAGALSGGMKQKLALCCALVHHPDILFLDEPTTGVDPVSRNDFWNILARIHQQGITIIVSTPIMDEARCCQRIAYMSEGSIKDIDTPEKIIKSYKHILDPEKLSRVKTQTKKTYAIEVNHLTKKFGTFTAVDDISFKVKRGEIFGFLGANGAGKTTAMRILCGLSFPTSGSGHVANFNIMNEAEEIKKNIGYMSQKFALYDDLKVWENLELYAGIYGMSQQKIDERITQVLVELDFEKERNTLVKDLPIGWKQKLAFMVSIFHRPEIVFLDEPTGGVDPYTRKQFWQLIYNAAEQGITVFVTTHYMDEAAYCDRISIMVDGKIKALDSPKNLLAKYNAASMTEVFTALARTAVRQSD